MSATGNNTMPIGNVTAPVDRPLTQGEQNAQADSLFIWMVVPFTAIFLGIGAYSWIRKLVKKWCAPKANSSDDIELQQRTNPQHEESALASPEPASGSSDPAPGLFYLNQDHATGVETPPPTYSASSIGHYFNKR